MLVPERDLEDVVGLGAGPVVGLAWALSEL
jgi:hypothetical protein